MASVPTGPVVRAILAKNIDLSADEVIRLANAQGVTAPDKAVRDSIYNIKSELRKKAAKAGVPKLAPAAAHETKSPVLVVKPEPAPVYEAGGAPTPPAVHSSAVPDLATVLANVAMVNTVMASCGGAESVRKVAEAVRACGGVDGFMQVVDLVVGIRGGA